MPASGWARSCLTNTTVSGIQSRATQHLLRVADTDSGSELAPLTADALVVCAGVASRQFASMLGDRINIYPVKGYSITVCAG